MEIRLPKLGEGADSGAVASIFVKVGDTVRVDDPLLELESEKAVASIPSPAAGTVAQIHVKQGDTVKVGQLLVTLGDGEKPAATTTVDSRGAEPTKTTEHEHEHEDEPEPKAGGAPAVTSPSIRKLAQQLGIDLGRVRGSARGGRIVMEDVRGYIEKLQQRAAAPESPRAVAPRVAPVEPLDFAKWGPVVAKPLTPVRAVIARRMHESWSTIPHVTQFDAADITALNELRKQHAAAFEAKGAHLTLTPLILKALVGVLGRHPVFNASLDEATRQLVLKQYINFGIAVDTDHGLIVPVIRDAHRKSVLALAGELEALAAKAKQRQVTADDLKGSSFTISNQGGIGSGAFTPIINRPDVAILGLGRGALQAVVRDGQVVPRLLLPLALSYDHRVIDGADAARFMVDLVQALEHFDAKELTVS